MLEKGVVLLWACSFRQYFFLFLFLSILFQIQCQVIRKSVELPVKDYLSAPKRNGKDGKDHLYAQASNIDAFRNFEVLSPHTPASALMFASLAKSSSNAGPTLLPLSSPVDAPEKTLFKPALSSLNINRSNNRKDKASYRLVSRKKSPSTDLLEDGLNKATKGYSFSFSDPLSGSNEKSNSEGHSQEVLPVYSTHTPLLYQTKDDNNGHLTKFTNLSPAAHDGIEGRNVDSISRYSQYVSSSPSQYSVPKFEEKYRTDTPQPHYLPKYRQNGDSEEYYDYYSREQNYNTPSLSKETISNSDNEMGPKEYYDKSQEISNHDKTSNGNYNSKNRQKYNTDQAPYVPPTIGVIGWKSNTDHETTWKPTKALMNMADHHIREDMKHKDYAQVTTTPIPPLKESKVEVNSGQHHNNKETTEDKEEEEEEEEEDEEEEEGEAEEEGDEEEEEEEEGEEETESEENNNAEGPPLRYDNHNEQPSHPPPRYENSAEGPSNSPSYQQEQEPPTGPPSTYTNSEESYRDAPENLPQQYQNSEEHYQEPSRRPPQGYENSATDSRESPPYTPTNSYENYRPSPSSPRYENSAEQHYNPIPSSPSYENSPEYNSRESINEYQNSNRPRPHSGELPNQSQEYSYDGQTLPPGPPYNPPSYAHDPRSKHGYLPPPLSYQPVSLPIELGVGQSWTPIIPTLQPASYLESNNAQYKSDNGRWLLNSGPVWKNSIDTSVSRKLEFGKERSLNQIEDEVQKQYKNTRGKTDHENTNDNRENIVKREKQENKRTRSDKLPAEHRGNSDTSEESSKETNNVDSSTKGRNSFGKSSKETSNSDYQPPPPPQDLDENRVRNYVSDREKPRKVPTRLHYPGGGLWAKPQSDLGFVPKKVYTQTRKHNVVKHLPREAALQAASTAEEVINAPRLREVVNHKKVQEVYEEEGYEDSGYDHGGYKKHGASKSDTSKHNSREHYAPAGAEDNEDPSTEEAYEAHLRHLDEIPEGTKKDPEGEESAKQLVQVSGIPKVRGSWKQQKTTSNERSLAFLDEEGKGGILTEKHPTRVEGFEGKYLDGNDKKVSIVKDITDSAVKFIDHGDAVSFQRQSPTNVKTDEEKEIVYNEFLGKTKNILSSTPPPGYILQGYLGSREGGYSSLEPDGFQGNFGKAQKQRNLNTSPSVIYSENFTSLPQLSSYASRNNRFSYMIQPERSTDNVINYYPHPSKTKYHETTETPKPISIGIKDFTNQESSKLFAEEPVVKPVISPHFPEKYSARFTSTQGSHLDAPRNQNSFNNERSYDVLHFSGTQSKERKSRDLTAVGIDGMESDIFDSEFTHPTAALRAIEDQMSFISRESFDRPLRSRAHSGDAGVAKKYKDIVRTQSQTQDDAMDNKKDKINVRLTDEDVNIRHPFLPRDESGGVKIDYVKIRKEYDSTTSPPLKQYFVEDVEVASVTEEPTTTTTHKVTTAKSETTTVYVPEDPSITLSRLKSNPFLSSIFQSQENQGESTTIYEQVQTTTTPKITTYRAKVSNEAAAEESKDTIVRLQNNPFLSSLLSTKEGENKNERTQQTQSIRGSRVRPIIIVPPETPDVKSDSVKHVEQLTLAHYSGPSHGLMYQQVPRRTQQRISNLARHLNNDGVDSMHIVVRRSADSATTSIEKINVAASGTTTEIPVDKEKYPFYYSPASVSFPKYSPLRYATSPKDIPRKTEGGMEFYESRATSIKCEEPTPPKNIIPKRGKDGEWNKSPQPDKQRLGKLGEQIDCLKAKYFGEDPLDNPLFRETEVGVPDFTDQSPEDSFGLHSDIKQNIKLVPEGGGKIFSSSSSSNWGVRLRPKKFEREGRNKEKHFTKNQPFQKPSFKTKNKDIKLSFNESPHFEDTHQESRITNKVVSLGKDEDYPSQEENSKISNINKNGNDQTKHPDPTSKTTIPPFSEIHSGSSGPIRLHPPKNVFISFKSKGTANHPRIKVIKGTASLYNVNVNVVPMSSVGYLKSHSPVHIQVENLSINNPYYSLDHVPELDPISSMASQITKQNRMPTTVTYLKMNPEGRLIHQHIRTFIPVPNNSLKENSNNPEKENSDKLTTLWDVSLGDERNNKPKFRVKRNHENDKYINSRESLELKNYLLHKYAEILAKEKEEASMQTTEKVPVNENLNIKSAPISTSRNTEGFAQGNRPQYSSRYRAVKADPMHQSPSTNIRTSNSGNNAQDSNEKLSTRKPKVRFPKLTMTSRTATEGNRPKLFNLPEPIPVRLSTTTTTTEQPPSTTTRMYRPKIVYKKEFGKPIQRVVDMFAVLKRQPSSSTEHTTTTTTENIPVFSRNPPNSGSRNFKPKRLQQFEQRTITKEEVIRRTYTPESRSGKARTYDSIYDHPDLRGPVSRISRDAEQEGYEELLVYMVNPMTGMGEWAVMPIPAQAISRIDKPSPPPQTQQEDKDIRKRSKNEPRSRSNRENSDLWVDTGETRVEENTTELDQEMTTSTPRKVKSKTRRKSSSRRHHYRENPNNSQFRNSPSRHSDEVSTHVDAVPRPTSTPEVAAPIPTTTPDIDVPTASTIHPRIIMEPYKRKYFYAKI